MSRHRDIKKYIEDAEEDDYQEQYGEDDDYDEESTVYYILDIIGSEFEYEDVKKVLEKFDYDSEKIIDHFLTNKEKILAGKKKAKEQKEIPQKKKETDKKHVDQSKEISNSNLEEEKKVNFEKSSSKKQIEIDKTKFNLPFPSIKYEYQSNSQSQKHHINIVIVGHVDAGKSTLTGHLLYLLKELDEKSMYKNERDSNLSGKSSFKYAWAIDETQEERNRGVTIDIASKTIRTRSKMITLLDAPGHKDFIPNMINGASQADAAILVIDSVINAFEAGFDRGGQTREHAYLIKALGVNQIIVVLNKMDSVNWSQTRYDFIAERLRDYLVKYLDFNEKNLFFVPISAFQGVNIVPGNNLPLEMKWYTGFCLTDLIDKLNVPIKEINKPLRCAITNSYQSNLGKLKGFCVSGKVESGVLLAKKNYLILPSCFECTVKEIMLEDEEKVKGAEVGQTVELLIQLQNSYESENFHVGDVLSGIEYPVAFSKNFLIEIITYELECPILKGMQVVIHINTAKSNGVIRKLEKLIDKTTGQLIKKTPRCIKSNECALIELYSENFLCGELFSNLKTLGRVILREKYKTLASGMIVKIL